MKMKASVFLGFPSEPRVEVSKAGLMATPRPPPVLGREFYGSTALPVHCARSCCLSCVSRDVQAAHLVHSLPGRPPFVWYLG